MDKLKKIRAEAIAEGCGVGHVNSETYFATVIPC